MADYDPELRVRLQELDRELEVGCLLESVSMPTPLSELRRFGLLADNMTCRRATLPRRGKQRPLDTPGDRKHTAAS